MFDCLRLLAMLSNEVYVSLSGQIQKSTAKLGAIFLSRHKPFHPLARILYSECEVQSGDYVPHRQRCHVVAFMLNKNSLLCIIIQFYLFLCFRHNSSLKKMEPVAIRPCSSLEFCLK